MVSKIARNTWALHKMIRFSYRRKYVHNRLLVSLARDEGVIYIIRMLVGVTENTACSGSLTRNFTIDIFFRNQN